MKRLLYLFIIPILALPAGCTASFPAVLLPERLDGTPYSSVRHSDKAKDTEMAEMSVNKEAEYKPADVPTVNEAELFSLNQSAPQFTVQSPQMMPKTVWQTSYSYLNPPQNLLQNTNTLSPQIAETISETPVKQPAETVDSILKTQKSDSRQMRNLLADIRETPQEEWKIGEKELAERLNAFRQSMKTEKNPEFEILYLKQLRNAVLPIELPVEINSEVAVKDADKDTVKDNLIKEIPPKKIAPAPKYGQLAQINEPANNSNTDNIIPASYNPQVLQQLPNYSPEYSTGRWEQQIRIGTDMLKREIEQTPYGRTFENEIKLRLLELALGNRNEAVNPFSTEEKRFTDAWSNMMLGISTLYDSAAVPDRKKRIISAAFRFDECSMAMNQFCPVRLRNVQLVNSWLGFGSFEPKEDVCVSGEEVGVYLELENPCIKRSAKGYNVSTAITYEIRDMTANIIEKSDKIYAEDTAPSVRHDHCIHFKVFLPKTMTQGQYQLRINVTDMNSENMQYAEEQIPLRIRTGSSAEQAR